jgi:ABC-2 type transport system ATP-binding protein
MTSEECAIETNLLGLTIQGRTILDSVSLTVRRGEVFGVLGPNGAGKTTTVRLLNGLLKPTLGSARVWGLDPTTQGDAVRRRSGVLTEAPALYERLTARENLEFFCAMHDLPVSHRTAAVERALQAVGLSSRSDDRVGHFSKGMQQRLAIARAIVHEPDLLFLDEPTAGLDPESAQRVTALVEHWRGAGRTIFLATHHLGDAERQCDRFAFYANGRVVATGTKWELALMAGAQSRLLLTFAGPPPTLPPLAAIKALETTSNGLLVTLEDATGTPSVVEAAVAAGGRVTRVEPLEASLEDLYFALVGRSEP